jgi:hypothetical protein
MLLMYVTTGPVILGLFYAIGAMERIIVTKNGARRPGIIGGGAASLRSFSCKAP